MPPPSPKPELAATPLADSAAFVRFAGALARAESLDELERVFTTGFGRLVDVPMYGFLVLEPGRTGIEHRVGVNVSEVFCARYERVMELDPLLERARATRQPVYNLDLMSAAEWQESAVYRLAYSTHAVRHVAVFPIPADGQIVGAVLFGASDPTPGFTPTELRLGEAIAVVLGNAIAGLRAGRRAERRLEEARAALELAGTAVAISRPGSPELVLNPAARRMLGEVGDAEARVHELLRLPAAGGAFARRTRVRLTTDEPAILHAHADQLADGGLVSVLELQRGRPRLYLHVLRALTPREREVAVRVVDGLTDREIAERLALSHHTVGQHVKSIYRKLGVDSRVRLTRLVTGLTGSTARERHP